MACFLVNANIWEQILLKFHHDAKIFYTKMHLRIRNKIKNALGTNFAEISRCKDFLYQTCIWELGTNFTEIFIQMQNFFYFKNALGNVCYWWPLCSSLSVSSLKVPYELFGHFELYFLINKNLFEIINDWSNFKTILSNFQSASCLLWPLLLRKLTSD